MLSKKEKILWISIGILSIFTLIMPVIAEAPFITEIDPVYTNGNNYAYLSYDEKGVPHIITVNQEGSMLLYSKVENEWTFKIIDPDYTGTQPFYTFNVDKNGNPHLCYQKTENSIVTTYYSRIINDIREDYLIGPDLSYCKLFLDKNDQAHFVYVQNGNIIHSIFDGSTFSSEKIDNCYQLHDIDVAFDNSNNIHVVYGSSDGYNGIQSLKYAYKNGNTWVPKIVDTAGGGDCKCNVDDVSIDLDGSNSPHLAYKFGWWSSGPIKYAHLNAQNIWEYSIIESSLGGGGPEGKSFDKPFIIIDSNNRPKIAYSSCYYRSGSVVVNSSIKLAYKSEGTWEVATVYYKEGIRGLFCPSFERDPNGFAGLLVNDYYETNGTRVLNYVTFRSIEKPYVESFNVDVLSGPPEQKFNITYSVVASSNEQLTQVELWRKFDKGDWKQISKKSIDGTTDSGLFEDTPGIPGTYQYGIHVVDTKDWADQLPLPPIQVTVNPPLKLESGYYLPIKIFNEDPWIIYEDPWGRWLSDQDEGYLEKDPQKYHCGVDLIPYPYPSTKVGRWNTTLFPVYSIADGELYKIGTGYGTDKFGNTLYAIYINSTTNEGKKFTTIYGHLKNIPYQIQIMKPNSVIPAGSLLGFTSGTGFYSNFEMSNHLHISISPLGCNHIGIETGGISNNGARPNGVDPIDWLKNTRPSSEPGVSPPTIVISDFSIIKKGNTFSGKMTVTNIGNEDILLRELLIGGRDKTDSSENPDGRMPNGEFPNFPSDYDVLIEKGASYIYSQTYQLEKSGDFEFFPYYQPFYGESRWILYDENNEFVKHYFFRNCKYKIK